MERCPSCQAEIRPGIVFCTQCGRRLPSPAAEGPVASGESWPAPPAQDLGPAWPLPESSPVLGAASPDLADGERAGPVASEPGDGPIWAEAPATVASPQVAAWPDPVADAATSLDGGAWVSPERGEAIVEDAAWRAGAEASSPDDAARAVPVDQPTPAPIGAEHDAPAPGSAAAAPAVALPEVVPAAGVASPGNDPATRAATLVDELRALLPKLASAPGDLGAVADRLEAAADDESGRWPDLRAAMEDARANPRDVETVLALARRVDEVIALIDANTRLAAAARDAATAIRRGSADGG